jgi:hypothetical protein
MICTMRSAGLLLLALLTLTFGLVRTPAARGAGIAGPGFAVSDFASDFPTENRFGPMGVAFDSHGALFAVDNTDGDLYKFSPSGGLASLALVSADPIPGYLVGLAFDKAGNLYAAREQVEDGGDIAQIDPSSGAVVRVVASGFAPLGITTDPVSGDLFVTVVGGPIKRISNQTSPDPVVTDYGESLSAPDGIVFGPDGTLYTEDEGSIISMTGTASPNPGTATTVGYVAGADGLAVAETTNPNERPFLAVNSNDGSITKVDLATNPVAYTTMVSGGTRGDLTAVGPDSCLYATQFESIEKVTAGDGTCPFYPSSPFHCSNRIGAVSPATGARVAIGAVAATTVTISGRSYCAGTQVQFGNAAAVVNATVASPNTLTATVPASATGGEIKLIDRYGNTGEGKPYTIDNYRDTDGFEFVNDFGAPKNDVQFADVAAAFGAAAYDPWSLCRGCPGGRTPTTAALQILTEAQTTLEGGLCFGFAMGSLRLSQGLDRLSNTVDPRRTDPLWSESNTWSLPEWKGAREPYGQEMRHYLYAQSIRQFSVQYQDQRSAYLNGLGHSRDPRGYLYSQVGAAISRGLALISMQVHYYDPHIQASKTGEKNAWDGHELVAYRLGPRQPDGSFNIYVYDPNRPYLRQEGSNADVHQERLELSQIHVDGQGNWKFNGDFGGPAGLIWSGPIDQLAPIAFDTVRANLTPISGGGTHALATGAVVSQVSDDRGRKLYDARGELTALQDRPDVQVLALAEPGATDPPALVLAVGGSYHETILSGEQRLFSHDLDGSVSAGARSRVNLALGQGAIGVTPARATAVGLALTRHLRGGQVTVRVSGEVSGTAGLRLGRFTTITAVGTVSLAVGRVGPGPPQTFVSQSLRLGRGERLELGAPSQLDPAAHTIQAIISGHGAARRVTLTNRSSRPAVRIIRVSVHRERGHARVTVRLRTRAAHDGKVVVTVRGAGRAAATLTVAARPQLTLSVLLPAQRRGRRLRIFAVALTRDRQAGRIATAAR